MTKQRKDFLGDSEEESHNSYGLVQISRTSGGGRSLFGSSIKHQNTIRIRIARGNVKRGLSRDWYRQKDMLLEIEMSPVQWAETITNLNCGTGTPCTILRVAGEDMGECPARTEREIIRNEFQDKMKRLAEELEEGVANAREVMEKKTLNKADRASVLAAFDKLKARLTDSLPFIHKQFDEAMEGIVSEAKGEIEAFYTNAVIRAGTEALAGNRPPELGDKSESEAS